MLYTKSRQFQVKVLVYQKTSTIKHYNIQYDNTALLTGQPSLQKGHECRACAHEVNLGTGGECSGRASLLQKPTQRCNGELPGLHQQVHCGKAA